MVLLSEATGVMNHTHRVIQYNFGVVIIISIFIDLKDDVEMAMIFVMNKIDDFSNQLFNLYCIVVQIVGFAKSF